MIGVTPAEKLPNLYSGKWGENIDRVFRETYVLRLGVRLLAFLYSMTREWFSLLDSLNYLTQLFTCLLYKDGLLCASSLCDVCNVQCHSLFCV